MFSTVRYVNKFTFYVLCYDKKCRYHWTIWWCVAYDCDSIYYICLAPLTVVSDHTHDKEETVFLVEWQAEVVLSTEKYIIDAPKKITIPANTYHKFTAITDVIGLEIK